MKKVSIIIATYHRSNLISRAIKSAINQTYKNIEVIIVDDNQPGSIERNETQKIISQFNDSRIIYLQNRKNCGGAVSRNNGIKYATGDYISFLDDDDEYLPTKTEVQVHFMEKTECDVSVMDGATYDDNDNLISEKKQYLKNGMNRIQLMRTHMLYHISGTNTFMFKTEKIREIRGFDNIPACQEYVLMQKAIEFGLSIGYVKKTLVKNHISEGERLSTSLNKIPAQELLINKKRRYFKYLNNKEKRKVLCRHYGVLLNIYLKNHKYKDAIINFFKCVISSPIDAWKWYIEYRKKLGV